jgi:hypothetical protein
MRMTSNGGSIRKVLLTLELQCSLYVKKLSLKNMKINQDMINDVIYKYAKFYYEILCIVGYTKLTKSEKIYYKFKI